MLYKGVLKKMQTEVGNPIQYYLIFKDDFLNVNQILNKKNYYQFYKTPVLKLRIRQADLQTRFLQKLLF